MQIEPKIIAFKARQPLKSTKGTRTLSRLRSGIGRHHPSTTHKYAASPLLFGKRTGYPRQDVVVLLLTNNKEAAGMEEMEEFAFYLEQKYRYDGIVEARILHRIVAVAVLWTVHGLSVGQSPDIPTDNKKGQGDDPRPFALPIRKILCLGQ